MPSDATKVALVLIALMHAKSLPGVYTLRSLSYFFKRYNLHEPSTGLLEASRYHSRVWFDDLDLNIHLNNSSYNKMMDYARIDLCTRVFPGWQYRHKFDMCLAQTVLFFKAEVPRFSKYTITSRIFTWDDKWIWMQHRFSIKRKVRPVRNALNVIQAAELSAKEAENTSSEPIRDEDVVVEEEDEDDIDPIEAKAPKGNQGNNAMNTYTQANFGGHPNDAIAEVPDKLCCIAYSRMVAKHPKGKTIVPAKLFEKMGHKEAFEGEWEQYRVLGMSLIEGMMKIGDPTADVHSSSSSSSTTAPRRIVNPTRARI
ncbi:hypothetical protein BG011_009132 [Mortierella polycephala]|uniref:Thioesterase/thiol ester dehydrase-isomerase n=1 Tax=Mortierella polycephala TaxID=41804 RepID=A0A9P6PP98_9FUNG|nr:hypothetical protein BG011_009132 [Mortierella polycephala]